MDGRYFVRWKRGDRLQTFVSVFEGFEEGKSTVKSVSLLDKTGVVMVETPFGRDYIMSMHNKGEMSIQHNKGKEKISGHFAAASVRNGQMIWKEVLS